MAPPSTNEISSTPRCADEISNSTSIKSEFQEVQYEFDWSPSQQMNLIGFYYFGYVPCHLLGGSLAFKYGFKRVLMISALGASVLSASFPLLARINYWLAVTNRVILGVLQV
jgi:MFS family permease